MAKKQAGTSMNRQRMLDNNTIAKNWLIKNGYEEIWLKQHTRYLDWVWKKYDYNGKGEISVIKYQAQDMWNLFDGMCWRNGILHFLAIGRLFKKEEQIEEFIKNKKGFNVLMIRVDITGLVDFKAWGK